MQVADPGRLQSAINVTPLVDVVLVLLITFMIVAPQMQAGPELRLPATERPPKADEGPQIGVSIERGGELWVDGRRVTAEDFPEQVRQAAARQSDRQVLIQADARLTFGEVRQVLLAVESAGLKDVGLIAEPSDADLGD